MNMKLTKSQIKQIIKEEIELEIRDLDEATRRGFLKLLGKGAAAAAGAAALGAVPKGAQAATSKDQAFKVTKEWSDIKSRMGYLARELNKIDHPKAKLVSAYVKLLANEGPTSELDIDHSHVNGHGWNYVGLRINEIVGYSD
jgi:hypothetical protein